MYGLGLVAFWPESGEQPGDLLFAVVILTPRIGALLAKFFGDGGIQFGRPNWIPLSDSSGPRCSSAS